MPSDIFIYNMVALADLVSDNNDVGCCLSRYIEYYLRVRIIPLLESPNNIRVNVANKRTM